MVKQNSLKVIFFISNLTGGGAQRTMVNLLRSIDRSIFVPTLVLLDYNPNHAYAALIPEDIEIINLQSKARYAARKIKRVIEEIQPDILFSTLIQVNFAVWLGKKISRSKAKLILRETTYRKKGINTTPIQQLIYRTIYRQADGVIGLSEGVANHMIESYRLDNSKVTTIYNPIDINDIKDKSELECIDSYNKKFKLISCGRLAKEKDYPTLIKALYMLKQNGYSDFELFILGEGTEKKQLETMVDNFGLNDHIKFIGFKENPYSYMRQADILILSSLWEGFGHVIVEAMACWTAVISSDCPSGPREIITDNVNGLLFKTGDEEDLAEKIISLINNTEHRKSIVLNGLNRSMDFEISKVNYQYEELFKNIANNNR